MTTTQATSLGGLQARMRTELTARLAVHRRRLDWDADQLAAHQADRLRALLARAIEHSPSTRSPSGPSWPPPPR